MRGFGGTARVNHDSGKFYARKMFKPLADSGDSVENDIGRAAGRVYCGDSRDMGKIPDNSVHLMVTSPPYNVGKDYDDDLGLGEYMSLLHGVFSETHRVLVDGGRACINIANVGRKPYIPLHSHIISAMLDIGFLMRGEVIWQKGAGAGASTAWGSWQSASNPTLRDTHEYILVFSKAKFGRTRGGKKNTISRDEFMEYTKSVWTFNSERAKRVGHPAPFPVELPYRCIQLYTFEGDVVLDPFCGSGSTGVAAAKAGRRYVMYDINKGYARIARDRLRGIGPG